MHFLLCQFVVAVQYFRLATLYDRHEFCLDVDAAAHLAACGSLGEPCDDALHLDVVRILRVVNFQDAEVFAVFLRLVENAQQPLQPVMDVSMQQGNLNDDTAVRQALHKGVRHAFGHGLVIVVHGMVVDVEDRLLDVAHTMAKQIDGDHRHGVLAVIGHVTRVLILQSEILAEAQRLCLHPRLLQLNEHQVLTAVGLAHRGAEVNAQHGQARALVVDKLMGAHLDVHDVLLEQGREDRPGDALVLHQVFEHHVIDRVGNAYHFRLY